MARPRKERHEDEEPFNIRVGRSLLTDLFSTFPRLGFRAKQDAGSAAFAIMLEYAPELADFLKTHPLSGFSSSRQLAREFKRWNTENANRGASPPPKIAEITDGMPAISKTSFNFPAPLLSEFRQTAEESGQSQTALAMEFIREGIERRKISQDDVNPCLKNAASIPVGLKLCIDAIRRNFEEMAALLTSGEQTFAESAANHQKQQDSSVEIGAVAGSPSCEETPGDLERVDELISRSEQINERARRTLADAQSDLEAARRIVRGEDRLRDESCDSRQKVG